MGGTGPASRRVTSHTELRTAVVHDQKILELIIVRIMTGCALHLLIFQDDFWRQRSRCGGVNQTDGRRRVAVDGVGKGGIVSERNRMICPKVGVEREVRGVHTNPTSTTADRSQGNRAIVTAQTKP